MVVFGASFTHLVLLHYGKLRLQLLQHLQLRGLQVGSVIPQLFQHLRRDGRTRAQATKRSFAHFRLPFNFTADAKYGRDLQTEMTDL